MAVFEGKASRYLQLLAIIALSLRWGRRRVSRYGNSQQHHLHRASYHKNILHLVCENVRLWSCQADWYDHLFHPSVCFTIVRTDFVWFQVVPEKQLVVYCDPNPIKRGSNNKLNIRNTWRRIAVVYFLFISGMIPINEAHSNFAPCSRIVDDIGINLACSICANDHHAFRLWR